MKEMITTRDLLYTARAHFFFMFSSSILYYTNLANYFAD